MRIAILAAAFVIASGCGTPGEVVSVDEARRCAALLVEKQQGLENNTAELYGRIEELEGTYRGWPTFKSDVERFRPGISSEPRDIATSLRIAPMPEIEGSVYVLVDLFGNQALILCKDGQQGFVTLADENLAEAIDLVAVGGSAWAPFVRPAP